MSDSASPPRIVIIGAGFAGAWTAKYLLRKMGRSIDIELINPVNYFVFQPLLPEVTSGTISAQDAVTPLRQMVPGVRFRMAQVLDVDFDERRIDLLQGSKRKLITIPYDHVVLACGQREARDLLPGLAEHTLSLQDVADAHHLRNVLIDRLEHADVTGDKILKRRLLTLVVAGGGLSGVETVGEVWEMLRQVIKYYPNIDASELRCILVQRDERILPEMPPQLAAYAHRQLRRRGVEIRLRTGLRAVSDGRVELDDGSLLEAATVIGAIGSAPSPLVSRLSERGRVRLQHGKLPVDRYLRLHPHRNAWAVGDAALIPLADEPGQRSDYAPPTAQFAVREARQLAQNLAASLRDEPCRVFHYRPRGALASIGHYQAVGEVFGVRLSGVVAWSVWRGFYMLMLPQFTTQVRVALNWFFDYFMPRSVVQIDTRSSAGNRYVLYRAGETIFAAGQMVAGHYLVAEGEVELRRGDDEASVSRVLVRGEYLGSHLHQDEPIRIVLTAKTDCRLLLLRDADVARLCEVLPDLKPHFQRR